jgi:glucose-1-phosphate cytidylyltransferase
MPSTREVPKPLLLVGDRPVLAHVMEIYADQGFTDFVLAAG